MENSDRDRFDEAVFYLDRKVSKAIRRFGLISDGDRILVGLSGGKDSLMLLHVLARRRRWRPERYEVVACHVRQDWPSENEDAAAPNEPRARHVVTAGEPRVAHVLPTLGAREAIPTGPDASLEDLLAEECRQLEVPFVCVTADPLPKPEELREKVSRCLLCSRRRKKALFETALAQGCRTVALAHHKEDAAETLLLNLLWQGRCEGIPPRREFFGGLVTVIRPFLLVDEADLVRACRLRGFPVRTCSCPYADRSRRETAAQILALARQAGAREAATNLLSV
ncbi:MAG: hypothetical protein H5T84_03585, partial [Thermoleophilia bacterium]|nr:hypothetical protein [Thermoleophilia bacterium]